MPRRKPASGKQRKAEIQLKRAVKRGDIPHPDLTDKKPTRSKPRPVRIGSAGQPLTSSPRNTSAIESSKRLQSAFVKLPPEFLEKSKNLAASLTLPRPIPPQAAIFDGQREYVNKMQVGKLVCPKRPKWRYEMTKKEVEKNEEGLFRKWLTETDEVVGEWQMSLSKEGNEGSGIGEGREVENMVEEMPRSPTYFERNLEVWRQLWRVTEISQIILVLLDSRCPLLHFPPSLSAYLSTPSTPSRPVKIILVLTKVDITGQVRVAAWTSFFECTNPGVRIVQVEAYQEKEEGAGKQGRTMYDPHLPDTFRSRLVEALKEVHEEMLEPPERIRGDVEKVARWRPGVPKNVDWEELLKAESRLVGSEIEGLSAPKSENNETERESEPGFLTIGLIGQPNVGKSSLLNALFGTQKVRASRTPGKTKHFQTIFWTPQVRLVDCPGLVMPNFVPMEIQVLSGILPISHVSAIPSCIHRAASLLPLESIFKLTHPLLTAPHVEDKRTWRTGVTPLHMNNKEKSLKWTAMDILTAYADKKGWVTAKAGRSDIMRAGNALLRALADGKVAWGFWPPRTDLCQIEGHRGDFHGLGIWIPHLVELDDDRLESSESESETEANETITEASGEESFEMEGSEYFQGSSIGRFAVLSLEDDE